MSNMFSIDNHELHRYISDLKKIREIVLTNAVMVGEIPAPTFGEKERIRFLQDRFIEDDLESITIDEQGNGAAIVPGVIGKKNILLMAHADSVFDHKTDHAIAVDQKNLVGPGIADNSLGLAVIASTPIILRSLKIKLDANLILLGASCGLGRGNLKGLRFFLENTSTPIDAGVCVAGTELGRLSYNSVALLRGEIKVSLPKGHDWERLGTIGAIAHLNKVIQKIQNIRIPKDPQTSIILGAIRGGNAFNTVARRASLQFEVRSEESKIVQEIHTEINEIIDEISALTETDITLDVIGSRQGGGLSYRHWMVKSVRKILEQLSITPQIFPTVGSLGAFIDQGIPGITIGITKGNSIHEEEESIEIEPIYRGLAQLVGTLKCIDEGLKNED